MCRDLFNVFLFLRFIFLTLLTLFSYCAHLVGSSTSIVLQLVQYLRLQDRIEVCLAEIAFARHVETISLESVVFSRVK